MSTCDDGWGDIIQTSAPPHGRHADLLTYVHYNLSCSLRTQPQPSVIVITICTIPTTSAPLLQGRASGPYTVEDDGIWGALTIHLPQRPPPPLPTFPTTSSHCVPPVL